MKKKHQLVKGKKYKINAPGAEGEGVYTKCFFNKEIGNWIYCFDISLGRIFTVEYKYILNGGK